MVSRTATLTGSASCVFSDSTKAETTTALRGGLRHMNCATAGGSSRRVVEFLSTNNGTAGVRLVRIPVIAGSPNTHLGPSARPLPRSRKWLPVIVISVPPAAGPALG